MCYFGQIARHGTLQRVQNALLERNGQTKHDEDGEHNYNKSGFVECGGTNEVTGHELHSKNKWCFEGPYRVLHVVPNTGPYLVLQGTPTEGASEHPT